MALIDTSCMVWAKAYIESHKNQAILSNEEKALLLKALALVSSKPLAPPSS